VNPSDTAATPSKRRDRRAAERKTSHGRPPAARPIWRSPIALLTAGALVAGILLIGAIQLLPTSSGTSGPAQAGTRTAAGVLVPMVGTPSSLTDGRAIGRADAPVKLVVWSDFQCPACEIFATQIEPQLVRDYVSTGKLRLEYRDFIVIGPQSIDLSAAARCAGDQGAFWPFHDVVFANQGQERSGWATRAKIEDFADAIGLDRAAFDACLATSAPAEASKAETVTGQGRVQSTPTLDFGSQIIPGSPPYAQLAPIIDQLVAKAAASGGAASPATSATP
jgi:protein-disulfide isomerase